VLPLGQYYPSAQVFYVDFPGFSPFLDSRQGSPVGCYTWSCAIQPRGQTRVPRRAAGRRGPRGWSQVVLCRQRSCLWQPLLTAASSIQVLLHWYLQPRQWSPGPTPAKALSLNHSGGTGQ